MPLTSIIIPQPEEGKEDMFIQFVSQQYETGLYVAIYSCDKDFKNAGTPQQVVKKETEEVYHKKLRKEAAEKGHLQTSHSTNPEWNPEGYTQNYSVESKTKQE